jgi:hypothetical protein
MKKSVQFQKLFSFFFFLFSSFILFGQPPYDISTVPDYYDLADISTFDFSEAYISAGPKPDATMISDDPEDPMYGYYHWEDMKWFCRTKSGAWISMDGTGGGFGSKFGYPDPDAGNKVLYVIPETDKVFLGSKLDARNKLTLLICGELTLNSLTIQVPTPIVEMISVIPDPPGDVSQVLSFEGVVVEIPQDHSLVQFGFFVYPTENPDAIIDFPVPIEDVISFPAQFSFLATNGILEVGIDYQIVAYAVTSYFAYFDSESGEFVYDNVTGLSLPIDFLFPLTEGVNFEPEEKGGEGEVDKQKFLTSSLKADKTSTVSINNFDLILCNEKSYFSVSAH